MKNVLILLVLIASMFCGCEKQELYDQLCGDWRIIGISGSIVGFQEIRHFDKLSFDKSGSYSVSYNDQIIQDGSYNIEKQDPKNFGNITVKYLVRFTEIFNEDPYANFYSNFAMDIIQTASDSLTLSQANLSDGFNYHFVKMTNH